MPEASDQIDSMPESSDHLIGELLSLYEETKHELSIFMDGVVRYIGEHPDLSNPTNPIVHSYKKRLKDKVHLAEKIKRKIASGKNINRENFFSSVTDLSGVRILHLFQHEFEAIDRVIRRRVNSGDWILYEKPLAYTWDPESVAYFGGFELDVVEKSSSYTSVHYVVKPRENSPLCCEIQVRTLFEEIWGEVDHRMNYPSPSDDMACKEQIRVLSKLVGAGSRLLDSLYRTQPIHQASPPQA